MGIFRFGNSGLGIIMLAGAALISTILYVHSSISLLVLAQPSITISITGEPGAMFVPGSVSIDPVSEVIWENNANMEINNILLHEMPAGNTVFESGPIADRDRVSYFFGGQSAGRYEVCSDPPSDPCGRIIVK